MLSFRYITTAMKNTIPTILTLACTTSLSYAATVYTMNGAATFEHDSNGENLPPPIPSAGSGPGTTGTFSWGNLASDTTSNTAVFSGTTFAAADWGGDGTFSSTTIDVSAATEITITAAGSSTFNIIPTEFFNFFYTLGGGAPITFASGVNPVVDVTGVDDLVVGFDFNHNGSGDNANVSELSVDAVPEPSSALLGSLALLGLLRRRR